MLSNRIIMIFPTKVLISSFFMGACAPLTHRVASPHRNYSLSLTTGDSDSDLVPLMAIKEEKEHKWLNGLRWWVLLFLGFSDLNR